MKSGKDGHRLWCKACCAAEKREERLLDRDYVKARARNWTARNRERVALLHRTNTRVVSWPTDLENRYRSVAKKKGLEFNLDATFLETLFEKQSRCCYWLGLKLEPSIEVRNPLQPSVDRLDCSKGYTRDNVVLACQFANMGRSAMTAERFQAFVLSLESHFVDRALDIGPTEALFSVAQVS